MSLVIIPQALRVIIPPLSSQYLNITKNSSLAIAIGYMDIVATIGGISLNQTGREMECMTIVLGYVPGVFVDDFRVYELVQQENEASGAMR